MADPTVPGSRATDEPDVEIAVLTVRFDARPGAEEALLCRALPLRRAHPPRARVPQRRPCGLGHRGGPVPRDREVGVGGRGPGPPRLAPHGRHGAGRARRRRDEARHRPLRLDLRLRPRLGRRLTVRLATLAIASAPDSCELPALALRPRSGRRPAESGDLPLRAFFYFWERSSTSGGGDRPGPWTDRGRRRRSPCRSRGCLPR